MPEKLIHHEFSPSRLPVLENCPYSYKNCLNWERTDNKDALSGRKMHEAIYNDEVFSSLSEKERNIILSIREEHIDPYKGENTIILYEEFLEIKDDDGSLLTSGWGDLIVMNKGKTVASLKDFKFGGYEVESAESNIQLLTYAVGLMQKYPSLQKVYLFVVQPLFNMADYSAQSCIARSDIQNIITRIKSIISNAKEATEKDAKSSSSNCRYCNKENCKTYKEVMQNNFYLLGADPESLPLAEKEMTIEFADKIMLAVNEIKKLLKTKEDDAKKVICANGGSEHFRMANGRKTVSVNWNELCKANNIPESEVEKYTTTKIGEPYVALKTKKEKKQIRE